MDKLYFSVIVLSNNKKSIEIFVRAKVENKDFFKENNFVARKLKSFDSDSPVIAYVKVYECDKKKTGIPDYDFLEARFKRDYRFVNECKEVAVYEYTLNPATN